MFINPAIQDKIYLGNLVSHNAQSNINIPEFTGYTFNPVTVSTSAAVEEVVKTYIPSQKEQRIHLPSKSWKICLIRMSLLR